MRSMIAESPMLITCNNCSTSYETEPWSFGLTGRSVRCIRCGHKWFAANMAALGAIAKLHRADLSLPPAPLIDETPTHPAANPVVFDQKPPVTGEIITIERGFTASVSPTAQAAAVPEQS